MTIQTPSGTLQTITPGRRWSDGAWHATGNEDAATLAAHGYIVQPDPPEPPPPPPPVARYSKLAIVRTLLADGLYPAFAAWLASDATIAAQWDAATEIRADDPVFGQALPTFGQLAGLSAAQIAAMLTACEVKL